jgi:hypothetical protein
MKASTPTDRDDKNGAALKRWGLIAIGCVILGVATPAIKSANRKNRLEKLSANLQNIANAKKSFEKVTGLKPGSPVFDSYDLVPRYLPVWPQDPPANAKYSANAIGEDPTVNGMTLVQIKYLCTVSGGECIF